jgi:L-ascorbate metabolism protein UlaG (beta-lactamase superfamily)
MIIFTLAIIATIYFYLANHLSYYKGVASNYKDGKFHNAYPAEYVPNLLDLLKWRLFNKSKPWPEFVENSYHDHPPSLNNDDYVRITNIGHVTFLIQYQGINIITDPHFSLRASPFSWLGPKRIHAPGIALENLPKIDYILLSHDHYDHMDVPSLKFISQRDKAKIITPLGNGKLLKYWYKLNADYVELNWWESYKNADVEIFVVPAVHWSSRFGFDKNKALWGGFVFTVKGHTLYFAGDTGYNQQCYQDIAEKFPHIDIAFLPIGAYEPRWFMKGYHQNPHEGVLAFLDLKPKIAIPMHFDVFALTSEGYNQAREDFKTARQELKVPKARFGILEVGEIIKVKSNGEIIP